MKNFVIAAVKDELTDTYLQPIFAENTAELIRVFKYQINNIKLWKENASDYSLYKLGEFNDNTGEIISSITKLVSGISVIKNEKEEKENEESLSYF